MSSELIERHKGFTPGPWLVSDFPRDDGEPLYIWRDDGRSDYYLRTECIAECLAGDDEDDGPSIVAAKANARLIADAPALLAALEAAASRERELEARVAALRAYVDHKADCAYFHFVAPRRCTCGLDAAMAGEEP